MGFEIPMLDEKQIKHDDLLWFTIDNVFSEMMVKERFYRVEDGKCLLYLFVLPEESDSIWKRNCMDTFWN